MAKLKAFTLGSFHSPGWLTPRWDVDRRNEEVGWGRPLCVHHGDISGCELLSVGPPDSGRPLPSAETARKREADRRLRRRKSWKRKSLQKALPRQPQGPSSPPRFPTPPNLLGERPALPSQARLQEAHLRMHSWVASKFPGLLIKMRNLRPGQPRRADNTLPGEPSHLSPSGSPLSRKTCFLKKKKIKK